MQSRALRVYLRRFAVAMVTYVLAVMAATRLSATEIGQGPAIWAIAVLPALPLLALFWIMARYLAEITDEYVRMLEVKKALIATGLTLAVTTVLGFLEIYADIPHVPIFFVPVIWFAGLGIGSLVNLVTERRAG